MWSSAVALPCRKACNAPSSPSLLRIGFSSRLTKLSGLSRFPRLLRNSAASACLPLTIGKSGRANWGEREKARGRRDLFGVMCLPNRLFQTTMIRFGRSTWPTFNAQTSPRRMPVSAIKLGYGERVVGGIGPNSMLIFVLVSIQDKAQNVQDRPEGLWRSPGSL
jgi:hypothetical protein